MRLNQHPVFSVLFHKFKRACLNISKIERLCAFEFSLSCQSAMSSLKRCGARMTQVDVLIVSFWFVQLRTMTGMQGQAACRRYKLYIRRYKKLLYEIMVLCIVSVKSD